MTQPSEWAMEKAREVYGNIHHGVWGWDENDFLAIARALDEARRKEREEIADQLSISAKKHRRLSRQGTSTYLATLHSGAEQAYESAAAIIRARGQ